MWGGGGRGERGLKLIMPTDIYKKGEKQDLADVSIGAIKKGGRSRTPKRPRRRGGSGKSL